MGHTAGMVGMGHTVGKGTVALSRAAAVMERAFGAARAERRVAASPRADAKGRMRLCDLTGV